MRGYYTRAALIRVRKLIQRIRYLPGYLPGYSPILYVLDLYLSQQTSDWHFATLYVNEDVEVYADGKDGFWI